MLKFGTSGLRGLVEELTDKECYLYTTAFLAYILDKKLAKKNSSVALAGDLRPSTERIIKACAAAIKDYGFKVDYCGKIPTPAVSLYAFKQNILSIMVTGSHIPFDRNGIKFNLSDGEILKKDEQAICRYYSKISAKNSYDQLFNKKGAFKKAVLFPLPKANPKAEREYIKRYLDFFEKNLLKNKTIVIFQHSTVIRDIMAKICKKLGAKVISLERSERFVPFDTEAISLDDMEKALTWTKKYHPDAIFSADGDGDRPALFDENGTFIRGDLLNIICSACLGVQSVSVTASCNTALEKSGLFKKINRTKIGSPYVIEAMHKDIKAGWKKVASYEANGGYLTGTDFNLNGKKLCSLPTRDSILPLLSALALARKNNLSLSKLIEKFPQRFVYSQSLKGFPTEMSQKILQTISQDNPATRKAAKKIFDLPADVEKINFLDGVRMFLKNGEIVHIRPSGNSPELRVYCETASFQRSRQLAEHTLEKLEKISKK